jgi:hypothetical protein
MEKKEASPVRKVRKNITLNPFKDNHAAAKRQLELGRHQLSKMTSHDVQWPPENSPVSSAMISSFAWSKAGDNNEVGHDCKSSSDPSGEGNYRISYGTDPNSRDNNHGGNVPSSGTGPSGGGNYHGGHGSNHSTGSSGLDEYSIPFPENCNSNRRDTQKDKVFQIAIEYHKVEKVGATTMKISELLQHTTNRLKQLVPSVKLGYVSPLPTE